MFKSWSTIPGRAAVDDLHTLKQDSLENVDTFHECRVRRQCAKRMCSTGCKENALVLLTEVLEWDWLENIDTHTHAHKIYTQTHKQTHINTRTHRICWRMSTWFTRFSRRLTSYTHTQSHKHT